MNRDERRLLARSRVGYGPINAEAILCPDCNSEVTIAQVSDGVYIGEVAHDATCPWYAELKQDLS